MLKGSTVISSGEHKRVGLALPRSHRWRVAFRWLLLSTIIATVLSPQLASASVEMPDGPSMAVYGQDTPPDQPFPPAEIVCFAQTRQCVREPFLTYWWTHGQLAVNGYPLAGEQIEVLEDGQPYTVQYFERVRLEYHSLNAPPYQILLGQFGRQLHPADPTVAALPEATYFAETGHNVPADFIAYWRANGGLSQFGYPLSELLRETLEDGNTYEVQYFERARFERHPENQPPSDVLLGQFGRRELGRPGRVLTPRCEASQLRGAVLHEQGITGGGMALNVSLVNASSDACWVRGYPTVQFADEQGQFVSLPGQVTTTPDPEEGRSTVLLRRGEATAFLVVWFTYCGPRPQRVIGTIILPWGGAVTAPFVDGELTNPPRCQDGTPTPTLVPPGTAYPVQNDDTFAQANVVYRYAAAIDARDYAAAYALFGPDLQAQQTYEDFVAGFATTRAVQADLKFGIPPTSVAMRLKATQVDGTLRRYAGTYEIGGVNGVLKIVAAEVSEQP